MGMDRTVQLSDQSEPAIAAAIARALNARPSLKLVMIDGLPAFPDETPSEGWSELRIGSPDGMVPLRRVAEGISLIVWGNASPELLAIRDAVADALASKT